MAAASSNSSPLGNELECRQLVRSRRTEVVQAHDGRTGLDVATRHQQDVIVCDLGLPGLDGYEVARTLRAIRHLRSSLLIAVSGYGEAADRDKAQAAGFFSSHHEPADPIELAELIANHVKME